MGRCPWGQGHWSRRSSEMVRRGRWAKGGCWRSSDLKGGDGRQPIRMLESGHRLELQSAAGVCYLCPGWWTGETGAAVVAALPVCVYLLETCVCPWASRVCVCATPPALWRGGCVLGSEQQRVAGVPANRGSPGPKSSSHTGALLPSGGQAHMPTSGTHMVIHTKQDTHENICRG